MDTATDLIKRIRAHGMTQSEISRRTGIPQPRLSRWEAGAPSAGANDALKLADLAHSLANGATAPAPHAAQAVEAGHA
ncbi:helix-turn-helix domain-containing protein [Bordetella avium]|uniref:helix-turn-helix domain-containing protein n=1 Tax=Bordetella avium TaxID=521 RepID=UPI000E695E8A|nr:helix-turn-helix transcriptional regulator [Bordetella avium]AZY49608.1 XRE family transcriptional regulator [Bordetella avium]RIQ76063.1 XRE family transcriptional regulator [Bordetella avium]RIQ78729.1 XRE family transcriptional regulator [Bordetella avium]